MMVPDVAWNPRRRGTEERGDQADDPDCDGADRDDARGLEELRRGSKSEQAVAAPDQNPDDDEQDYDGENLRHRVSLHP